VTPGHRALPAAVRAHRKRGPAPGPGLVPLRLNQPPLDLLVDGGGPAALALIVGLLERACGGARPGGAPGTGWGGATGQGLGAWTACRAPQARMHVFPKRSLGAGSYPSPHHHGWEDWVRARVGHPAAQALPTAELPRRLRFGHRRAGVEAESGVEVIHPHRPRRRAPPPPPAWDLPWVGRSPLCPASAAPRPTRLRVGCPAPRPAIEPLRSGTATRRNRPAPKVNWRLAPIMQVLPKGGRFVGLKDVVSFFPWAKPTGLKLPPLSSLNLLQRTDKA
jgi:hypothetical protein